MSTQPPFAPLHLVAGTETILLVEDDLLVRDMMQVALQTAGYTVLAASNGQEALELCRQHAGPVHLLLTDVVLPDTGGQRLKEQVQGLQAQVRTLFISGHSDALVEQHGVTPAGASFISKPVSLLALTRRVRDVLDR